MKFTTLEIVLLVLLGIVCTRYLVRGGRMYVAASKRKRRIREVIQSLNEAARKLMESGELDKLQKMAEEDINRMREEDATDEEILPMRPQLLPTLNQKTLARMQGFADKLATSEGRAEVAAGARTLPLPPENAQDWSQEKWDDYHRINTAEVLGLNAYPSMVFEDDEDDEDGAGFQTEAEYLEAMGLPAEGEQQGDSLQEEETAAIRREEQDAEVRREEQDEEIRRDEQAADAMDGEDIQGFYDAMEREEDREARQDAKDKEGPA